MTSNRSRRVLVLSLILALCLSLLPGQALARDLQGLTWTEPYFILPGNPDRVIGVVASGDFSFPVVQQEEQGSVLVTTEKDKVTQFGMASDLGNIGLLAHNYLAGKQFFHLELGQRVFLVYGSGRVEAFTVTRLFKYQALTPTSPFSEFREVGGEETLSAADMFYKAYGGSYHLTLQTCIERFGESSWGRLFVIAEPAVSD